MCRLDGVEGDVYGFDKACFCWGSLISWEFLVCYSDASCSYRAFCCSAGLRAQHLYFNVSCCANKLGNRSSATFELCASN